jgi:hypothetical protein
MLPDSVQKNEETIKSFLLIGQSNMSGRGDFNEVPVIVNNKCFMLPSDFEQKMLISGRKRNEKIPSYIDFFFSADTRWMYQYDGVSAFF